MKVKAQGRKVNAWLTLSRHHAPWPGESSGPHIAAAVSCPLSGECMSDMPAAGIDRPARSGSPGLVLGLAILLVAVVGAFSILPRDEAQRLILAFLALLAVIGV